MTNYTNLNTYDYYLPEELIAQTPLEPRDSSRLLVCHKDNKQIEHKVFRDIIDYLKSGDVLVVNNELLKIIEHYSKLEEYESALIICNLAINHVKNNHVLKIYKEKKQEIENLINNQMPWLLCSQGTFIMLVSTARKMQIFHQK